LRHGLTAILAPVLALAVMAAGCARFPDAAVVAAYAEEDILITGLSDADFSVDASVLVDLEQVARSASATRANGEKVSINAQGPLLETFLAQYGKHQADFSRIRFTASDGYSIAVSQDMLKNREIILALADGGKPLSSEDAPVRVVIPGERAMYWVRLLNRIDFESEDGAAGAVQTRKLVFLEEAVRPLPAEDYDYYGAIDRTVTVKALLEAYGLSGDAGGRVYLLASDGLEKSETLDNFLMGRIKFTGADSPRFVSEALPVGMHVMNLAFIGLGDTRFVSLARLMDLRPQTGALYFSDLVREGSMADGAAYLFVFGDGSSETWGPEDLAEASVEFSEGGRVTLALSPEGERIPGLLSVETLL
jgi:hypothetical protein